VIAIKTIPPQPSLMNKGGSKPLPYIYMGLFPLILRRNTRGINSSVFRGYHTVSSKGGSKPMPYLKLRRSPLILRGNTRGIYS